MKKEVDSYEKGKRIPVCQLQAIQSPLINHVSNLLYSVKLEGTKDRTYVQLFRATTGKAYFHMCTFFCCGCSLRLHDLVE